jgi:hypothetical protein
MVAQLPLYDLLQRVRLYYLVGGQEARIMCYCSSKPSSAEPYTARQHSASK